MGRIGWARRSLATMVAVVTIGACGGGSPGPTVSPTGGPTDPNAAPTAAPSTAAEAWDLVWFSDSSVAAAADPYAAKIHERLGVTVRLHNFFGPGDRGSASFIADLTEVEAVELAIKEAEVIVLYTNPARTSAGDAVAAACMEGQRGHPPEPYTAADFKEYADTLRVIYERIFELRPGIGKPLVIRAIDAYVPVLSSWRSAGVERECTAVWEVWTSVSRAVAAEFNVPMASMYDAFNGPKHDQDPKDKGLISSDGAHPSDAGTATQVAVLDALGYEPLKD